MKRKSFFALSLFLIAVCNSKAQQKIIDSLEQQYQNPTNGLSKIEILNELSWYYYAQSDTEIGIQKANMAISEAEKNNDSLQLGLGHERKGLNFQKKGKDSIALGLYDFASNIYTKIKHHKRLASLNYNIGFFHMKRANYDKSIEKSMIALEVFTSNKDTLKIARTLNQIGVSQLYLGNYTLAQNKFHEGLHLLEHIDKGETVFYAEILSNEGLLQEKLSHYQTALELQKKALIIHEENENISGISIIQNNIGKLLSIVGDKKNAISYFKKSYELKKKIGNQYRIANVLTNIGLSYASLNKSENALKTLNQSKKIYDELNHETNLSSVHKAIGEVYLEINELKIAEKHFDSAVVFAVNAKDKRALYLAKDALGEVAFKNRKYRKAYSLNKEAEELKNTMLSEEKRDELAQLKANYEYEKEKAILQTNFEKDRVLGQAKIKQQALIKNISIGAGVIGISILSIILTLYRRKKEASLNEKLAKSELRKIRAQLNPHFIHNSLNSMSDFVLKNEKNVSSNYIARFSSMMRGILDNSSVDEVYLENEIEFLKGYIKLEQERLENRFDYKIEVDSDIDEENTLVPPVLYQPFIENSIWHGLSDKKENGQLTVIFRKEENSLVCTIDDNGLGMKKEENVNKKSFGMSSTKNRIELLREIKKLEAQVEIFEKDEGVRVVIQIPLSLEF